MGFGRGALLLADRRPAADYHPSGVVLASLADNNRRGLKQVSDLVEQQHDAIHSADRRSRKWSASERIHAFRANGKRHCALVRQASGVPYRIRHRRYLGHNRPDFSL